MSPCLGSWAFQLGHVFSDMDREQKLTMNSQEPDLNKFQLGHVFSDMDSRDIEYEQWYDTVSGFQLGHVFSDMDSL